MENLQEREQQQVFQEQGACLGFILFEWSRTSAKQPILQKWYLMGQGSTNQPNMIEGICSSHSIHTEEEHY